MSSNVSLNTALKIKTDPVRLQVSASDEYLNSVIQKIRVLFEHQQFCDVTLIAANDESKLEVMAHRVVLSAASEYFQGMFGSGMRESNEKVVPLKEVDSHSLKAVINFIYTASIELTTDTVEDIIKTAQLFRLSSLELLCSDFIAKQLDPSNCIGITLFAEHHNFKTLYEIAEVYVCQNFVKLRKNEEFYLLNVDQLSKFIASDELRLPSEEEVFHSVMSWVNHDKTKREQHIAKLLNHVRFPLLLPKFIASTVEVVCNSIECERLILKAYKWQLLPEFRLSLFSEEQTKLRNFKDMIIAASGWDSAKGILNVGLYHHGLNEWIYREWPGPSLKRSLFGSSTFNGKLIIAGGMLPSGEATNRVECLDMKTLKWSKLPPLATARKSCKMETLNGEVYVFGGENSNSIALSSVEKYNPVTRQWQALASMHEVNSRPRVAIRFNSLCVSKEIENYSSSSRTFTHNIYDPSTDTWTDNWLSTNGELLGMGTVSVLSTEYFIVISRTCITRYNLAIKSYANIPTDSIKAECTDCKVIGDRIIVHGQNEFQEYHVFQNEWKTLPRLANNRGNVLLISN